MSHKINCTQDGIRQYPLHTHKQYEIMLYLEGQGYMRTDQGDFPFCPGTVVIVPPHVPHGSVSEDGFKNISIEGDFEGYLHVERVRALSDNEIQEGMMLARLIYGNRYGNAAYLSSLCRAYACFLMQRLEVDCATQRCVRSMILEISQNALDSEIDLSRILSGSGYAEDYIRSCFKKATGKTPHGFLTEIRIKHACFLMEVHKNELSLAEIAERCGYTDYSYFSKKFKSVMGQSPRKYRLI